jgi:hypothetical protein
MKLPKISPRPIKIIAVQAFYDFWSFVRSRGIVLVMRGTNKPAYMATLKPFQI